MDQRTKDLVEGRGPIRGILAYITARPDNERVTVFDWVV